MNGICQGGVVMKYGKKDVRKKQRELNSRSTKWGKKIAITITQVLLIMILIVGIIGASAVIGVMKGVIATAPDVTDIDVSPSNFSTFVYDNEGNQISKLVAADSNRILVSSEQIPEILKNAFIAIEDERFYSHNGIDIKGLMRAGITAVKTGFKDLQGASTITQQLIKNSVFPNFVNEDGPLDSLKRKIQEQYLAIELEKVMDKDTILVNYLNTINLAQNTLGVQSAALRYFNKDVSELTLSECAVIAAITQNPSGLNPITHPENNAERRAKVLTNMKDQGMISQEQFDEAMADDVYSRIQNVNSEISGSNINSYFVDALTDQLYDDLLEEGYTENQAYKLIYSGGLSIYSTMDTSIQQIVDDVFTDETNFPENIKWQLDYALTIKKANGDLENHSTEMYKKYFQQFNKNFNMLYSTQDDAYDAILEYQAAVLEEGDEVFAESISLVAQPQVSITIQDQHTGYVVAIYGGRGEKTASKTLNRATDTMRQPGSTFKILSAYAPALDCSGMTLANVYNDAPFWYTSLSPKVVKNADEKYRGLTSFRQGIVSSINVVAVKTLTEITPQLGYDYLEQFGFTTLVESRIIDGKEYSDIQQSTALGGLTDGVKNIELNAAYASIANEGVYIEPTFYTKVLDHDGNVLIDKTQPDSHTVLKASTAFLLTSAMTDVVNAGTGTRCKLNNMVAAGKTGTTSNYVDVWFAGFTPYYTATTWAGYDNNTKLSGTSEKNLAKTLWQKVMSQVHEGLENKPFSVPSNIVTATVCSQSGKLPISGLCDAHLRTEYFEDGTVPTEYCDVHYAGSVCAYDGLPACEGCPFAIDGVLTLTPVENEALQWGSLPRDESGNVIEGATAQTSNQCQHNAEFMADPNSYNLIQQQWAELAARNAAAAGQ